MSSGELNQWVSIQSKTATVAANGDRTAGAWADFECGWARIDYMNGSESSDSNDSTKGKAKIKMRYLSGVTTKMQIVTDSDTFDIEDVFNQDGRKRYLTIMCVQANK